VDTAAVGLVGTPLPAGNTPGGCSMALDHLSMLASCHLAQRSGLGISGAAHQGPKMGRDTVEEIERLERGRGKLAGRRVREGPGRRELRGTQRKAQAMSGVASNHPAPP